MAVSIKDIATRAGISDVTVSLALRDHPRISQRRRREVRALAEEMGYRPDPLARAMRTRKSQTVGLLLSSLRTGITNLKIEAIEHRMIERGYQVLLGFTGADPGRLLEYAGGMIDRRVDGLIVYGSHGGHRGTWSKLRRALDGRLPPCVVVDAQADAAGFPRVEADRASGMAAAAAHLLDLGHRDLLYVGGTTASLVDKWDGVLRAVRARPKRDRARVRFASMWADPWYEAAKVRAFHDPPRLAGETSTSEIVARAGDVGRRIAALPDRERPTGILGMSDLVAMSVIDGLLSAGMDVPHDASVCGFDGDDTARLLFRPRLTTVRQPQEDLAERVVQTLLDLMTERTGTLTTNPRVRPTLVEPQFCPGESTGAPPLRER